MRRVGSPVTVVVVIVAMLGAPAMETLADVAAPAAARASPSLAQARTQHATLLLADGSVLVIGGTDGPNVWNDAERLDAGARRWRSAGTMSVPRNAPAAVLLADGRVLVAGGHLGRTPLANADVYDPVADRWEPTAPMRAPRRFPAMARLADGRVIVMGQPGEGTTRSSAEIWDPATGRWTPTAALRDERQGATVTALRDGRVLVAGGTFASYGQSAEIYDPTHDRWTATEPMVSTTMPSRGGPVPAEPKDAHTATLLGDGRVLFTGGRYMTTDLALAAAQVFDPQTGTFRAASPMREPRVFHSASVTTDGRVLVSGGLRWGFRSRAAERRAWAQACEGVFLPSNAIRTAELWDPSTDRWTDAGRLRVGRWSFGSVLLRDGRTLLTGGSRPGPVLRSVELLRR